MNVGILQVSLHVEGAGSLKEKRHVVRSLLDRVRARFNISAAEVDDLDLWQRAGLGFAAVSNDARLVRGLLQQVLEQLRRDPGARVIDHQIEVL